MPAPQFIWTKRTSSEATSTEGAPPLLSSSTGSAGSALPEILSHLITQRGIVEPEKQQRFLHPRLLHLSDPFLIPGTKPAVQRIFEAIDNKEKICIYGDYDVDGITSITLMRKILQAYGVDPQVFIPRRSSEGYGLSISGIERCFSSGPPPSLMIAVDCGTVSAAEIKYLKGLGADTVVVDHHEPSLEIPLGASALVNPKCGDHLTYLCAAGVVFKLGHALLKTRPADLDLKDLLDLVAIATIADIVPLVGENRIFVRQGLKRLPKTSNQGLKALLDTAKVFAPISSMDIGFRLAPRINAAGRMDRAEDALATLTAETYPEACALVEQLEDYNRQRQTLEATNRSEATAQLAADFDPVADPVIVLGSRNWHPGVVGIVASRLMHKYYKPTFVIAIDEDGIGKGSGRSIHGVSLVDAIRDCADQIISGGGHAMAAGLSIEETKIPSFREKFGKYILQNSTASDRLPRLSYDIEVPFSELSLDFMSSYDLLQPFGNSNPQPVFISRNVSLARPAFHMKNHHLRLSLCQGFHEQDAVYFGGGEYDLPSVPWDIAFTIDRNTFRGHTSLQLIIKDIICHGSQSGLEALSPP